MQLLHLFSVSLGVVSCVTIIANPDQLNELIRQLPAEAEMTVKTFLNISYGLFLSAAFYWYTIIWTYVLLRKNKAKVRTENV
jgi:hypothetical protein